MADKEEEDDNEEDEDQEKPEYFYRMICLIVDIGTELLRKLFLKDIPAGLTLKAYLKSHERKINSLKSNHVFNDYQLHILNSAQSGVCDYDISLLYILVSNITNIQPPSGPGGWKQAMPLPYDMSAGAQLIRLRTARNEVIAHSPNGKMTKSNFERQWTATADILLDLAGEVSQDEEKSVKEKVGETRTKPIVDEIYKRNTCLVWKLQEGMDELRQKMATQDSQTVGIDTTVKTLSDQIASLQSEIATLSAKMTTQEGQMHNVQLDVAKLDTKLFWPKDSRVYVMIKQLCKIPQKRLGPGDREYDERCKRPRTRLGPGDREYDERKQNLQKEIMEHYRQNPYSKVAIPALTKDKKADVNDVFVMPSIRVCEPETSKSSHNKNTGNQAKYIRPIHGMFMADREPIRKVYLRGEAGTGKTTLCLKIVSVWCKVHEGQQSENQMDEDEKFLKNFEFLFYIPLRNCEILDIVEMIKTEIVKKALFDDLDLILENESKTCLIILDGLDEWSPSQNCRNKVPWIDPREKFYILTTSRPWKLEIMRPEMPDLGQLELCGLEQDHLIEAIVGLLNNRFGRNEDWKSFKYGKMYPFSKSVNDTFKKIKQLAEIPVILTEIICLWFDGEDIGTTRIQIYTQMTEYLLSIANKRNQEMGQPTPMMGAQKSTNTELINVFKGYTFCEMYSETLFKLSDLAYHTLISTEKEKSLVFSHSETKIYKLTESDVKFCLNVGLLSQSEFYGKAASDQKCISFHHKMFQEYFAGLFIAHGGKDRSHFEMLQTMKTLNDVFEMSEILKFLSGLRPDLIGDITQYIAELTDKDDRVLKYRNTISTTSTYNFIVKRVSGIVHDCIVEVAVDRKLSSKVELYDVRDDSILEGFRGKDLLLPYLNTKNIKSLWIDTTVVNDWIDKDNHNLVRLDVNRMSIKEMGVVVGMIERCASTLSVVSVASDRFEICSIDVQNFFSALCSISHLQCFQLSYMKLNHSCIEKLSRFLSTSTCLREIHVGTIICTTCAQCRYTVDLSHHKHLQYLEIECLDGDFILSNDTRLEQFKINMVKCDSSIVNRLKSSQTLQDFIVGALREVQNQGMVPPLSLCLPLYKVVIEVTPTLTILRHLTIEFIDFKQHILRLSPEMTSLEDVGLWYTRMTLPCVQGFIDSLPQTKFRVVMSAVTIYPPEDVTTAVKYITDRHQNTKPHWGCKNIVIDGKLHLMFINPFSHGNPF